MKNILFLLLFIPFVLNGQSKKISELGAATSVTGTELIPIVQGATTKSVTAEILARYKGVGIYNVLDYGADRTGATETTTDIQAAIDAGSGGHVVLLPAGTFLVNTLVVTDDSVTIQGAGMYLTKLILVDNADATTSWGNMLYVGGTNKFTIRDLEMDGNGLGQTKIADRDGNDISRSVGVCADDTTGTDNTDNLTVENCYIHDFAHDGVIWSLGNTAVVRDCYFKNNFVAAVEFWGRTTNGIIENCDFRNGTGGSFYGDNHILRNSRFKYFYNANMHTDYDFGFSLESATYGPDNVKIHDCSFEGDTMTYAILAATGGMRNLSIDNVFIKSSEPDHYAMLIVKDTNTVITRSHILGTKYGITLNDAQWATVANNYISGTALEAIQLGAAADNVAIVNNTIKMTAGYPVYINAGATGTKVANNILDGAWGGGDIIDGGTSTVSFNNYSVIHGSMLPNVANNNMTYTATVGGLTTGIITPGSQNVTVTSASANNICCLPSASSATIGTIITGVVGANGFELRVAAAQAATVYLNGVTTNVEAAIPANTNFRVTQVDATHWILEATTALGAVVTAIIPDAV